MIEQPTEKIQSLQGGRRGRGFEVHFLRRYSRTGGFNFFSLVERHCYSLSLERFFFDASSRLEIIVTVCTV